MHLYSLLLFYSLWHICTVYWTRTVYCKASTRHIINQYSSNLQVLYVLVSGLIEKVKTGKSRGTLFTIAKARALTTVPDVRQNKQNA